MADINIITQDYVLSFHGQIVHFGNDLSNYYTKPQVDAAIASGDEQVLSKVNTLLTAKQDNLTSTQLNAVDSGITAAKVAQYDGYATGKADKATTLSGYGITNAYTKTEVDNISAAKANVGLDNLSAAGQMIVDSVNGTISNCVLEIPQNIKLELKDNVLTLKAGSVLTLPGNTYTTVTVAENNIRDISKEILVNSRYYIVASVSGVLQNPKPISKIGSGNTLPSDNSTYGLYFLTTDRLIYDCSNQRPFAVAYPIAIIDVDANGNASFAKDSNGNDMIFNGAGFIGHHAFILPGVKGLAPDGFNADGSMKSSVVTSSALVISELNRTSDNYDRYITLTGVTMSDYQEVEHYEDADFTKGWVRYYVRSLNRTYVYNMSNVIEQPVVVLVNYQYPSSGNVITGFTIRQPVRTATVEMLNNALGDVETLLANI